MLILNKNTWLHKITLYTLGDSGFTGYIVNG